MPTEVEIRTQVEEYYGKVLTKTEDLQEEACCDVAESIAAHKDILKLVPQEVTEKFYGCGCAIPPEYHAFRGATVVDLGSGTGLECMVARARFGPSAHVIGVDMTDEQLEIARRNGPIFMERLGSAYAPDSLEFRKGYIEFLDGIEDESVDLVISNCVINLSPRKDQVMHAIARVLKHGGQFYISDVVSDRRSSEWMQHDPVLVGECVGLAQYELDFRDQCEDAGFRDIRVYSRAAMPKLSAKLQADPTNFSKVVFRGFKGMPDRRCEDYGHIARYKGNLPSSPAAFQLDAGHLFERGKPELVCRNTAFILTETAFAPYFDVSEPSEKHFGLFDCGPSVVAKTEDSGPGGCC